MGNRKNYSKISTEGAKAKQAEEIKTLYEQALKAMRSYGGQDDPDEY